MFKREAALALARRANAELGVSKIWAVRGAYLLLPLLPVFPPPTDRLWTGAHGPVSC